MGQEEVHACLHFVEKANHFFNQEQEIGEVDSDFFLKYDQVTFDLVSGLDHFNKIF
jgi:hypothetical protein